MQDSLHLPKLLRNPYWTWICVISHRLSMILAFLLSCACQALWVWWKSEFPESGSHICASWDHKMVRIVFVVPETFVSWQKYDFHSRPDKTKLRSSEFFLSLFLWTSVADHSWQNTNFPWSRSPQWIPKFFKLKLQTQKGLQITIFEMNGVKDDSLQNKQPQA